VFRSHGTQAAEPSLALNEPGAQSKHCDAAGIEYLPAPHFLHIVLPTVAENEPAAHGVHTPSSSADPTPHDDEPVHAGFVDSGVHGVQAAAPTMLKLPASHAVQTVAPSDAENVFTGHDGQAEEPGAALK